MNLFGYVLVKFQLYQGFFSFLCNLDHISLMLLPNWTFYQTEPFNRAVDFSMSRETIIKNINRKNINFLAFGSFLFYKTSNFVYFSLILDINS